MSVVVSGCGSGGSGGVPLPPIPTFNAGNFSGGPIDNVLFPLVPGTIFTYEGETEDGDEEIIVEVTSQTKLILGVLCVEVHDVARLDGEIIENTLDWYAQDNQGNVWYFGEFSEELENGLVVSTEGSWEGGVNGAIPGIIMLASPVVGQEYAQETAPGVAEDRGRIVGVGETVTIGIGVFNGCLHTEDFTPLDPGAEEDKYYAPGVGTILEISDDGERTELVSIQNP